MKRPAASLPSASVREGQSISVPVPKVMKRPAKAPKGAVALGSVEPVRRATKHDKDKKHDDDFVHHAHQPEWAALFLSIIKTSHFLSPRICEKILGLKNKHPPFSSRLKCVKHRAEVDRAYHG